MQRYKGNSVIHDFIYCNSFIHFQEKKLEFVKLPKNIFI